MTYKLLLLPPKFPLPTLADFLVYRCFSVFAQDMLVGWHLPGCCSPCCWVLTGSGGVLGSSPSSAADSLGRSLLSSCMMSSVVDDLRAA